MKLALETEMMRDQKIISKKAFAKDSAEQVMKQSQNYEQDKQDCFVDSKITNNSFSRLLAKTLTVAFFVLTSFTAATAQNFDFLPNTPRGMVNDYADMLTSGEENRLEQKLRTYRDTTTNVISIAILESLEGNSIEEVAGELANKWRMWEGDRYNGVLIFISEGDRELRIEVGYGLEGAIPDAMANRIVEDVLVPNLRNGNVYGGLNRATDIIVELAAGEFEGAPEFSNPGSSDIPLDLIIFFIVIIFIVITRIGRGGGGKGGRRRRTLGPEDAVEALFWGSMLGGGKRGGSSFGGGGGFGGGGFGGFSGGGGFGFGGGGASGSW